MAVCQFVGTAAALIRQVVRLIPLALICCLAISGCTSSPDDGATCTGGKCDGSETAVCSTLAIAAPNNVTGTVRQYNFAAWPPTTPITTATATYTRPIDDPNYLAAGGDDLKARLAAAFATQATAHPGQHTAEQCQDGVTAALANRPNVYIFYTGFGGAAQDNSVIDQPEIIRWINQRDPRALVFSINWACPGGDAWCSKNATARAASIESSPAAMALATTLGPAFAQQLVSATRSDQEARYDSALSHAMWLGAKLVDQLLVIGVGDIHIIGYSMGAHAAAQILAQDFGDEAFGWKSMCGSSHCTIGQLPAVKWSLAMGLSGWSEAMQSYYAAQSPTNLARYGGGGLFRVPDPAYAKLAVLNRRSDPTGNSGDLFQRGFNDIFFADYSHYGHDYSLPLFNRSDVMSQLARYLDDDKRDVLNGFGVVYDGAGLVDFDDCPADDSTSCKASTSYLAHLAPRSHGGIDIPLTSPVLTTKGVPSVVDGVTSRAVDFASTGASLLKLRSFNQEDLRGGVEFYFQPDYGTTDAGHHGLFSYGGCSKSNDDLMPQAFYEDGRVVFAMNWQGMPFSVAIDANQAGLASGRWSHLAFVWQLPVERLPATEAAALGPAVALASALAKAPPSSFLRQKGQGTMAIYVNGRKVGESPLGGAASTRGCLRHDQVIAGGPYDVNGTQFPTYNPYSNYRDDAVQGLGTPSTLCKAYRIRNTEVDFGCAGGTTGNSVTAAGAMDNILLVAGDGRTEYPDVSSSGQPQAWVE